MTNAQRTSLILVAVGLLLAYILGRATLFTVNERELAVVLQFGDPVASYKEPGLCFKLPLIQEVRRLPKTYQFWSGVNDVLVDLPTKDGKKVEVTAWAIWKITDPGQFVRVLRTVEEAESRVSTFVRGEMRDVITSHDLAEAVRSTDRELTYTLQVERPVGESTLNPSAASDGEASTGVLPPAVPIAQPAAATSIEVGREKIVRQIKEIIQQRLSAADEETDEGRGIQLVDVGISRIDFVTQVREAAFERLIAFMESIAAYYTNEGERRKQEIINRTEAEVQKIEGEGSQQSNTIRGEVDAEVIDAYAGAIRETGEFYNFTRTLEAYKSALGGKTRLVLTTDSQLLRLLNALPEASSQPPADTARTPAR
ncbi:MAG: protease modulator HflC [Rhodopirellula sp.]|nr:protease modulator HflC [Rhodopirellula sp.]